MTDEIRLLVGRLTTAGLRPTDKLVEKILVAGAAAVPALIERACDIDQLYDEPPRCYAPIHALRLLGELCPVEAIAPLVHASGREFIPTAENDPPDVWLGDVGMIIGRYGAAALEPLWALIDDETLTENARAVAFDALGFCTASDPELRTPLVTELRRRLGDAENPVLAAQIALTLGALHAAEAYKDVMARYAAKTIETELAPAGPVRQMLLAKSNPRLGCVLHTLDERYAQHGPVARTV